MPEKKPSAPFPAPEWLVPVAILATGLGMIVILLFVIYSALGGA